MRPNPTAVLVSAVVLALGVLAAVVGLEATEHSSATVLSIGGPLVTALFVAARVDLVTAGQNSTLEQHGQQLAQITAQTNGVLDQRIRDGVTAALAAAGVIPDQPPADLGQ